MRNWSVLMPGFGVINPAFEMCMKRISALQLYLLRKEMRANRAAGGEVNVGRAGGVFRW